MTIPRFGTFGVRELPGRQGRDPRTGAAVEIALLRAPASKARKGLRKRVGKDD